MLIGTKLGPYQVEAKLGEGGMGEVYKARDTRLDRSVAIKVLPAGLSADPDRRARFEREARAIAALSHPHICTLHDIGNYEGGMFLVMELLDGETLAARLRKGPLPVDQVLTVAAQIADGLAAAHRQGVIHRDLKPGNVLLTRSGAKLLDFGLAKLNAAAGPTPAAPSSLQTQEIATGAGMLLGTLPYMSPEQLHGKDVDARSDLFSFGALLYEMLAGRRAFEGDSHAGIVAAILEREPPSLSSLQPVTPAGLDRLVRKCLAKDPAGRWQSASDVADELRWLIEGSGSGKSGGGADRAAGGRFARVVRRHWWALVVGAGALAVTAAALAFAFWPRMTGPSDALLQRLQVSQVPVTGNAWRPALSPDGKYLVYVRRDGEERRLRMRQLGTERDVELLASEPGLEIESATVTPDGSFVDVVRGKGNTKTLWRMPFLGGSPKRFIDGVSSPVGWSADGRRLAFVRADVDGSSALVVADADGANERTLATRKLPAQFLSFGSRGTPSGQGAGIHPAWSPDGDVIAVIGFATIDKVLTRQVVFVDAATGAERSVPIRDGGGADGVEWLDSGHLVLSHIGRDDAVSQLWLLSYPTGAWSRLTNDLSNYASFGVSADRKSLAVARWDYQVGISVLDGASREPSDLVPAGPFVGEDLAWAGDTLLYAVLSPANNLPAICALRRGESSPVELLGNAYSPAATPDGETIVFSRVQNDRRGIWRSDREGRGAVEVGTSAAGRVTVTPDGTQALFLSLESGVQSVWSVALAGGKPVQLANVFAFQPVPSPDGRMLAFVSIDDSRRPVIAVCDLSDCSSRRTLPLPRRPAALQWTPDGRGLAYATLSNIWVQPLGGGPASQLTHFPDDDRRIQDFEWSADGRRLAFSRSRTTWGLVLFRGLELAR
jgi:Tol biopolymer transport system component